MSRLRELDPLPTDFASDETNIPEEFYCPCLRLASGYSRISGYFSSLVYLISWSALKTFVTNNSGTIRMICSPKLSKDDAEKIRFGYNAKNDAELITQLREELESLLDRPKLRKPTRLLACLIANEILQVKLAEVDDSAPAAIRRMFHDKVGIFSDNEGNHIGFRGSLNETFLGLSPEIGHIESIDVFPSWVGGRDQKRAVKALSRFDRIWSGTPARLGINLYDLPPEIKADIVAIGEEVDLQTALDQLEKTTTGNEVSGKDVSLRRHQQTALDKWEGNDFRGILAHATGSGKTVTGVFAIKRLLSRGVVTVVIVPSTEIQDQWVDEIRSILSRGCLLCGGGHSRWKTERLVKAAASSNRSEIIVTVLGSARTSSFLAQLEPGLSRCLMIIDEVHRVGAPDSSRILRETSPAYRLGLSATPSRAGDPEGTERIMEFFDGIIDEYSLPDAIEDGYLSNYRYSVVTVTLSHDEQERWDQWTVRIGRLRAQMEGESSNDDTRDRYRRALQERAKIKKGASQKSSKAVQVILEEYETGDRWLLYCDNRDQLDEVLGGLSSEGLPVREFHSTMKGDRDQTLRWFRGRGGILVSMQCLDEGVDIPKANRGLILASSTNEREFIQRRGRLLRKSRDHAIADLVDMVVLPADRSSKKRTRSLLAPELARALLFARDSISPHTESQLEEVWLDYELPLEELEAYASVGFEQDEENEKGAL